MIFLNIFSINSPGGACIVFQLKGGGICDLKYIKRGGYYLKPLPSGSLFTPGILREVFLKLRNLT